MSHQQVLFRSTQSNGHRTRIDILFKGVEAMQIRSLMRGLAFQLADASRTDEILNKLGEPPHAEHNFYNLTSGSFAGFVVASSVFWVEDHESYDAPSQLLPD